MPIPGTVQIAGPLAPTATSDVYPTHFANYGKGGVHNCASIAERNAITPERRVVGMLATVVGDENVYKLEPDLVTWIPITTGGGIPNPIPLHGPTSARLALGTSFGTAQSGYPFYDTDIENLFYWNVDHWETNVVMGYGPRISEYVGTPIEILPLNYRKADRWTNTASPACTVYVCRVDTITHSMADWIALGKQGS